MLHQEDPLLESKRGYVIEDVPLNYQPEKQMNANFAPMMARTWSMVTSTFPFLERKDPDNKEDDKT